MKQIIRHYPYVLPANQGNCWQFERLTSLNMPPELGGDCTDFVWVDYKNPQKPDWIFCEATTFLPDFGGVPRERRVLNIQEPKDFETQSPEFINQFGVVIKPTPVHDSYQGIFIPNQIPSSFLNANHQGICASEILNRPANYHDIMGNLPKTKNLSMVSSIKLLNQGHLERVRFMGQIGLMLAGFVDIFCREIRPIRAKFDALAPYKYHIAVENDIADDYYTEKLSDAILTESVCFYYGAPNIAQYFNMGSIIPIDIKKPQQAAQIIVSAINQKTFENNQAALKENKDKFFNHYHIHALMRRLIRGEFTPGTNMLYHFAKN